MRILTQRLIIAGLVSGYLLCAPPQTLADPLQDAIEKIEQTLEQKRLHRLERAKQGAVLAPFTTDGCSGGLTVGWEFLADKFPKFQTRFGQLPPWQSCCVAHDKQYWLGTTANGFQLRVDADKALKSCAEQTGRELAPSLSKQYRIGEKEIIAAFNVAAELMYRSVRLGGQPCTVFAWRWGYGWPLCERF